MGYRASVVPAAKLSKGEERYGCNKSEIMQKSSKRY